MASDEDGIDPAPLSKINLKSVVDIFYDKYPYY